jgi:hypothetical protein
MMHQGCNMGFSPSGLNADAILKNLSYLLKYISLFYWVFILVQII